MYSKATFQILTLTGINVEQLSNTGNKQIHIGCPHLTLHRQQCFTLILPELVPKDVMNTACLPIFILFLMVASSTARLSNTVINGHIKK